MGRKKKGGKKKQTFDDWEESEPVSKVETNQEEQEEEQTTPSTKPPKKSKKKKNNNFSSGFSALNQTEENDDDSPSNDDLNEDDIPEDILSDEDEGEEEEEEEEGEEEDEAPQKPKSSKKRKEIAKLLGIDVSELDDLDSEDLDDLLEDDDDDEDDNLSEDMDDLSIGDEEEEEEEEVKKSSQSTKSKKKKKNDDDYLSSLVEDNEILDDDEEEEEEQKPKTKQEQNKTQGKKGKKKGKKNISNEEVDESVFENNAEKSQYEIQLEQKQRAKAEKRSKRELEEQLEQEEREEELREARRRQELIKKGKIKTKAAQEKDERARQMLEKMAAQGNISIGSSDRNNKKKDKKNNKQKKKKKGQEQEQQEKQSKSKKGNKKKKSQKKEEEKEKEESKIESKPKEEEEEEEIVDSWEDLLGDEDEDEDKKEEEKQKEKEKEKQKEKEKEKKKTKEKTSELSQSEKDATNKALEKQRELEEDAAKKGLRSPICCILGHVDTGKTKLLDRIRKTKVQTGEAGGITQQIGASYFPLETLKVKTKEIAEKTNASIDLPGLLIIDTPGHESFTNLRSRGSSLCDIAILVVDIMHGLENQTLESLRLLRQRKTPFIVALNKIDRLFDWEAHEDSPSLFSLKKQKKHVRQEFDQRLQDTITAFAEQGLNAKLYSKNPDLRRYVSLVPTSAVTGEGIPDILMLMIHLTQKMMSKRLAYLSHLQCTVLEVKVIEGLGTTIDVVLVNGVLHEGDTIVVCGLNGPIVTTVRALLTPHPLRELRVKGDYLHHKEVRAAQGIKISAQGLEGAVAGSNLLVAKPGDDLEELKDEVMEDLQSMLSNVDKSGRGVCVQASTLGSLEALLEFLKSSNIPVSGVNIGPVHKKDVMRAATMIEHSPEYAVILAFDVQVAKEAKQVAHDMGVQIFTADIIYHLFDQFTEYMDKIKAQAKSAAREQAVFPVQLQILSKFIFHKVDPILCGVEVEDGTLHLGTPIVVPNQNKLEIGRISSIKFNDKDVQKAKKGQQVSIRIDHKGSGAAKILGKHFNVEDTLYSKLTRKSIDTLKENFKDDLTKEDWMLVIKIKQLLGIKDAKK